MRGLNPKLHVNQSHISEYVSWRDQEKMQMHVSGAKLVVG